MQVKALDHVNISTPDTASTARFYGQLFGLEAHNGPAPFTRDQVLWLYDHSGHAVIHLVKRDVEPSSTGAIHHVAFSCSGKDDMLKRLHEQNIECAIHENPAANLTQIFVTDPHGILLELNFLNDQVVAKNGAQDE